MKFDTSMCERKDLCLVGRRHLDYGNMVIEFLKEGYKIRTIFGRKLISYKEIIMYRV